MQFSYKLTIAKLTSQISKTVKLIHSNAHMSIFCWICNVVFPRYFVSSHHNITTAVLENNFLEENTHNIG